MKTCNSTWVWGQYHLMNEMERTAELVVICSPSLQAAASFNLLTVARQRLNGRKQTNEMGSTPWASRSCPGGRAVVWRLRRWAGTPPCWTRLSRRYACRWPGGSHAPALPSSRRVFGGRFSGRQLWPPLLEILVRSVCPQIRPCRRCSTFSRFWKRHWLSWLFSGWEEFCCPAAFCRRRRGKKKN